MRLCPLRRSSAERNPLTHDHEYEHVHYDEHGNAVVEEHKHSLFKADRLVLKSVGIDIGSTTSHLVFSSLELRRQGAALSSRFQVADRSVDYRSPIIITPFLGETDIDTTALSRFFEQAYAEAGIRPEDVDTGAVITTGDAARKENAEAIVQMFSERAGNFVCASAGPILEAKMAAYGSGAVIRSNFKNTPASVLNIDVGGGTSKLAIVVAGRVREVAAINVGARLITLDENDIIKRVERAGAICSQHHNLGLEVGARVNTETLTRLSVSLAESLLEAAAQKPPSALTSALMITPPLKFAGNIDVVLFSGGVSEYFYKETSEHFDDIGELLAAELRTRSPAYLPDVKIELPKEGIRATVIGASQFTVQVSGNTIYLANPDLLPLRSLRAVMVNLHCVDIDAHAITHTIEHSFEHFEVIEGEAPVALAIHWPHGPAFAHLQALCRGIADALPSTVTQGQPIVIVLDSDVARLVGETLSRMLGGYANVTCIDGVQLQDFDYIDISREHEHTHTVTVAIKSLVFSG